jgi:stringent starvation protein B
MAGTDDSDKDGGEHDAVPAGIVVDFAARRRRQKEHEAQEAARKAAQQRAADAARTRPTPAELGPDRPEKLRVFARLAERGMVMVTLDARSAGVRVPPHLAGELQLNLNFSLRFGIDDFAFDDDGVRASLSFRGTPFSCDVPWSAVYLMTSAVDAERLMWPDSLPSELATLVPPQARPSRPTTPVGPVPAAAPAAPRPAASPTVTSPTTSGDEDAPVDGGPDGPDGPRPGGPRPTLRRVK